MMWQLDSEACLLDPEVHGTKTTGKYLVMLMIQRDQLIMESTQSHHGHSKDTELEATSAKVVTQTCSNCLVQFAQLRQNLEKERRMAFVIAEQKMLNSTTWSTLYVDAVKMVNCACPMIVWHPKRNKCQFFDCTHTQSCQHALEQTLDGNVSRWLHRPWPT